MGAREVMTGGDATVGVGWRHAHYAELLHARPSLDFLEVHSENFFGDGGAALATLLHGRALYPVSLHGVGLGLGSAAGVDDWHLEQLARLVQRVDPVRVSDHACFARGIMGSSVGHAADLLPLPFNRQALSVLSANVQRVQDRLKRRLFVENLSAYIEFAGSDRHEAEFLVELAQRTGCGLLVDVNNLYVNALNAERAGAAGDAAGVVKAWLDRVPGHVVGEIHLAGHSVLEDIVIDDHGSRVCEAVWQLYDHALRRFGPVPTLIEWDTLLPPLDILLCEAQHARQAMRVPQLTA